MGVGHGREQRLAGRGRQSPVAGATGGSVTQRAAWGKVVLLWSRCDCCLFLPSVAVWNLLCLHNLNTEAKILIFLLEIQKRY